MGRERAVVGGSGRKGRPRGGGARGGAAPAHHGEDVGQLLRLLRVRHGLGVRDGALQGGERCVCGAAEHLHGPAAALRAPSRRVSVRSAQLGGLAWRRAARRARRGATPSGVVAARVPRTRLCACATAASAASSASAAAQRTPRIARDTQAPKAAAAARTLP
jgi:hypothetical protein